MELFAKKVSVLAAVGLMLVLVLSVGVSAFAYSGLLSTYNKAPLAEHHKPGHDQGNGNGQVDDEENDDEKDHDQGNGNGQVDDEDNDNEKDRGNSEEKDNNGRGHDFERSPMFQPAPSTLGDFQLSAEGQALTKHDGRDGPFTDAKLNLRATVLRDEGNHFRFLATGTAKLQDGGEFDIVDAQGIIIFFKNFRGHFVSGLMLVVGKHVLDENGHDLGSFHMRALVMGNPSENTWRILVFPAARLGQEILLVNMDGTIKGLTGNEPSSPGSSALHHFVVSTIPSSVPAGSSIEVTVTAYMSNATLLKNYEDKAKITDTSGTVTPLITPRFQDGVFKGTLNITKATSSDRVKFVDVDTGKSGESNSFAVVAGSLAMVDLMPSDVSLTPGAKAQFTAKGTDKFGNELGGLTFTWSLSSQNHGSISTSGDKANFTAASSIASTVELNLTASSGAKSDKSEITINLVNSQVLDHFVVGNVSSPQTAGVLFQVTVRAVNSSGSTITGYSGPMRLTDTTETLNMTITTGFVGGVWTGNANITESDDEVKITASDIASPSKKGSSNKFEVVAGALHHFDINPISNQTAGTQFNAIVMAEDAFGNLKPDYLGNVTLSSNDGASPKGNVTAFTPASHNFTSGENGQYTFAAKMYNAKENVTITATGSGKSGTSNEFDVMPAAVSKVTVSPTSATVSPGGKASFSAQAFDSYGNTIEGANFVWSLDSSSLGDVDETSASTAEFSASSSISSTTAGTLTAKVGAAEGSASVTVEA